MKYWIVTTAIVVAAVIVAIPGYHYYQVYYYESVSNTLKEYFYDDFSVDGNLKGYLINNLKSIPVVEVRSGRYYAEITDNSDNVTLHYKKMQGRLDAVKVSFPFEVIVRNIGIGTLEDSQRPPIPLNKQYIFAGVQVHVENVNNLNSSHIVVGHRGNTFYTVEGKNTVNGISYVSDEGSGAAAQAKADIRIIGLPDHTLRVMWQTPNFDNSKDSWELYSGNGRFPGKAPDYGEDVLIGLITYAQGTNGLPFVGSADSFRIRNL